MSASVTADKQAEILRRVIQAVEPWSITPSFSAAYSVGAGAVMDTTLVVSGTATTVMGIHINFGSATIGADKVPEIERRLIQLLEPEDLSIAHNISGTYTIGTKKYNVYLVLT